MCDEDINDLIDQVHHQNLHNGDDSNAAGLADYNTPLYPGSDNVSLMLSFDLIDVKCGLRILHEKIERVGYSDYYGFANPMTIVDSANCQNLEVRARNLADNLANRYTDDKLYLVPYLHEDHWMLIMINPSKNTAQWCNSFGGKPRRQAIDLTERALTEFHLKRGTIWNKNSLTWSVVDVPRQPGGSECALCVMRYMSIVVTSGQRVFAKKLENKQVYKRTHFSSEKEEWAQMFLERIVPMYVARR
ncbi:hypothetical protein ACFE04_026310 [Oxalis oulophora]